MTIWNMEYHQGGKKVWGDNLSCFNLTMNTFDGESDMEMDEKTRQCYYPGLDDEQLRRKVAFVGIDGRKVSDFVLESHRVLRERYSAFDRNEHFPVKLPLMPQFRKISCIVGEYSLQSSDVVKSFDDSIGVVGDWREPGPTWEIPFRTLYPANGVQGLLCAGRCSSATGGAWEVTRVIPSAALTGQVAGLAASLANRERIEVQEMQIGVLQEELMRCGLKIHR